MLEVTSIIVMSVVLLSLTILMVTLFMKHLNVMYVFIEEMLKAQNLIYKELQTFRLELINYVDLKKKFKDADNEEKNEDMIIINNSEKDLTYDTIKYEKEDDRSETYDYRNIDNLERTNEVSDEELSKLIKDRELIFRNQVTVGLDDEFVHTDIDYMQ